MFAIKNRNTRRPLLSRSLLNPGLWVGVGLAFSATLRAAAPVSDDFHATSLNTTRWTFTNPVGNGTFAMTGSDLILTAPAGSNHDPSFGGADNAVRVSQPVSN